MNVRGAQKRLLDAMKVLRPTADQTVPRTIVVDADAYLNGMKALAALEVMARTGLLGDHPRVERSDGTVIHECRPVTPEDVPDAWVVDLDAEVTGADIEHARKLIAEHPEWGKEQAP